MSRKIFVNLCTHDLPKTLAFWKTLGFEFNAQFTGPEAACMILSSEAYVMFLTKAHFESFARRPIVDSTKATEVLLCLSADSKEKVHELVKAAIAAGGSPANEPFAHGDFMVGGSFYDPDGHHWEVAWMDPAHVQK